MPSLCPIFFPPRLKIHCLLHFTTSHWHRQRSWGNRSNDKKDVPFDIAKLWQLSLVFSAKQGGNKSFWGRQKRKGERHNECTAQLMIKKTYSDPSGALWTNPKVFTEMLRVSGSPSWGSFCQGETIVGQVLIGNMFVLCSHFHTLGFSFFLGRKKEKSCLLHKSFWGRLNGLMFGFWNCKCSTAEWIFENSPSQ